jgi:predicted alpha-1,6-mannanase (GH76 family)
MTDTGEPDYRGCAAAAIAALQRWYRPWTGQWRTTGWWNAANALTALVDYTERAGDPTYSWVIGRTFRTARWRHRHFLNRFLDDNGWWAMAWLRAYELTGDERYLAAARRIFASMTTAWDDVYGGGLWWSRDRTYKNAITNELFLALAARLHRRSPGRAGTYLDWALREWEWFDAVGLLGPEGLINDGLTAAGANNGKPAYTYNQGVILGGLADLYLVTGDEAYLRQGESIADAALRKLTAPADAGPAGARPAGARPAGVLTEPGESGLIGRADDASQFKGIFVRYLCEFYSCVPRPEYRGFILHNARSIWHNNRNAEDQFGLCWAGPFDTADASRQSSALDALNAAVAVAS